MASNSQKTLNAWIVLGGKIDSSFTQLGNNLTMLGSSLDGISRKLIDFGKESVDTYRSYEDSMLDAQVAMATTYGKGSAELNRVMKQLDAQASEWAATTIFHTDDVAAAIAEAAHANWDLDEILEGMPAAMRLAQAGGLDLSTGLDYIIKSTNAAGISFADLGEWVDEWTYSANSSAGTVEEFGEAMLKMGATMRFADNKEELLTMMAVLHDAGTTGSNAGTLLRNSMIRLVAPTKKASDAMEALGVAQSDIDEALGETSGDLTKALQMLDEAGFSAYNSSGKLKDFTTIFEDLNAATKGMSEEDKYDIWSAIFPTRSITGAMSLIEAADKNWNGLLDDLKKGKAEGYGEYASETMMSGLTGGLETFNSKVEELKRELGQQLAPQVEDIAGNLGKVIDLVRLGGQDNGVSSGLDWLKGITDVIGSMAENMQGMDPAVFDALVAGLGSIATIGPTLLAAGVAIRTVGWGLSIFTGSPIGQVILAAAAIGILATAIDKYNEARYKDNFGSLTINTDGLDQNMQELKKAFEIATEPTNQFATALDTAVKNYETASSTFSSTMIEDLLKDQTLTGDELDKKLEQYRTLGSNMVGALKKGIIASGDMSAEFWALVFKGQTGEGDEDVNNVYAGIIQTLELERGEALQKAEAIGNSLQKAITKAWADGNLSEEEREDIKEFFRQLNEAMAEAEREAQSEQDFIKRKTMMAKAQNMSIDQMTDYINDTIVPQREEELTWFDDHYYNERYSWEYKRGKAKEKFDQYMAEGNITAAQYYGRKISLYDQNIAQSEQYIKTARAGIYQDYDKMILNWFTATGADSNLDTATAMQAAGWMVNGTQTNPHTLLEYLRQNDVDVGALETFYSDELKLLGGIEAVRERVEEYRATGDTDLSQMADQLEAVMAILSIVNPDSRQYTGRDRELTLADYQELFEAGAFGNQGENYLKHLLDEDFDSGFYFEALSNMDAATTEYINGMIAKFSELYNVDMINEMFSGERGLLDPALRDDYATAVMFGMSESERSLFEIGGTAEAVWKAEKELEQAQKAYEEAYAKIDKLPNETLGATSEQWKQVKELDAEVKMKEQALKEAQDTHAAVQEEFAEPFMANVQLNVQYPNLLGFLTLLGAAGNVKKKAKGGRETEPAIFAEAGIPEWYIPEEHTENTARLILAAAANSGFSFIDLAEYAGARLFAEGGTDGSGTLSWGSLDGGGDSISIVDGGDIHVQYAPVIYSDNADGVEKKLKEDKARFHKFFEEFMAERELYRSMAAYE